VSLESAVYRLVAEPANPNCVTNCVRPLKVLRSLMSIAQHRKVIAPSPTPSQYKPPQQVGDLHRMPDQRSSAGRHRAASTRAALVTRERPKESFDFRHQVDVVNGEHLHTIGFLRPVVIVLLFRASLGGHPTEYRVEREERSSSVRRHRRLLPNRYGSSVLTRSFRLSVTQPGSEIDTHAERRQ
jgi:hypothetical protein